MFYCLFINVKNNDGIGIVYQNVDKSNSYSSKTKDLLEIFDTTTAFPSKKKMKKSLINFSLSLKLRTSPISDNQIRSVLSIKFFLKSGYGILFIY